MTSHAQHLGGRIYGGYSIPGNFGQGGQQQIAEVMSAEPVTRAETVIEQPAHELAGESAIDLRRENLNIGIDYVRLDPTAYVYPPVLEAIKQADAIIMGPGDIYTSVLPNLLVEDVSEAILASTAIKIHVCNLMTKPGESDGFRASDFVRLLMAYLGTTEPLDYLLFNDAPYPQRLLQRYASDGQLPVELDLEGCQQVVRRVVTRPMLAAGVYLRHDPLALGSAIMEILGDNCTTQNALLAGVENQGS